MAEHQYAHYKNFEKELLGLMCNATWYRDPRMLGIHLARYKFVAKMLSGKQLVAEIGCGDGWYGRVVKQEVALLHRYDFDPMFVNDNAQVWMHDILLRPLDKKYDAIYSLDVMEHIAPENESIYLANICSSLDKDGIFIVGMPSIESQLHASPDSKAGHVNCKSGEALRETLQGYFKNVFMFGMNDETLHMGFFPMCHYLLAVCVGVK